MCSVYTMNNLNEKDFFSEKSQTVNHTVSFTIFEFYEFGKSEEIVFLLCEMRIKWNNVFPPQKNVDYDNEL